MFILKHPLLSVRYLIRSETTRCLCGYESNFHIFKNYFGLHQYKAKAYIERHKLTLIPPESIMSVVTYCKRLGFTKEEILRNPGILRLPLSTLDQYYRVMIEGGFNTITVKSLSKFRSLYRKTVHTLKELQFIEAHTNVASSFIKCLNPCPEDFYVKTLGDGDLWGNVHLRILTEYLKWRLQLTDDKISNFVKVHPTIQRKSFRYICHNISFAQELGFTPEQILRNGYMLRAYPKNIEEVLEKFPELAGVPIKKAIRMYPKLTTVSATSIEQISKSLKEHNIPETAIARRLNVFYLSPDTVEFRLKELERVEDFKVLLNNPNVLRLVVHHNRAKSRLLFLKELQLKCATVSLLGNYNDKFDGHIKEGRDVNSLLDTYAFLKGIFRTDVHDFDGTLKKHPYYLQVPLTQMELTYEFLIREGFSNNAVSKVIYILLYPMEKVKTSFEQVRLLEKHSKKKFTQVNKLNLALYFIEKEHHFTGDGIWAKSDASEEHILSS